MFFALILAWFSCAPGEYEFQYHYALTRECAAAAQNNQLIWSVNPPIRFEDYGVYMTISQPPPGDYVVHLQVAGTDCIGEIQFHH
jgi:hypothetical protein